MERRINGSRVDLERMSSEALRNLRKNCDRSIATSIRDVSLINAELVNRADGLRLPEFGRPFQLVIDEVIESNVAPIPKKPDPEAA